MKSEFYITSHLVFPNDMIPVFTDQIFSVALPQAINEYIARNKTISYKLH